MVPPGGLQDDGNDNDKISRLQSFQIPTIIDGYVRGVPRDGTNHEGASREKVTRGGRAWLT